MRKPRQPDITSNEYRAALAEDLDTLLRSDLENHPLYLQEGVRGELFRIELTQNKNGAYDLQDVPVTMKELNKLEKAGFNIFAQSEAGAIAGGSMAASSSCPVPSSFTLHGTSDGAVYGSQRFLSTNRPSNKTTQWVTFNFSSTNYRGRESHTIVTPFYKDKLHGWGGFIGDNHLSSAGCGSSALFNSQIEGWYQLPPQPAGKNVTTENWRSKTFNGANSCGSEMHDGWPFGTTYRMTLHATTGKWVGYQIEKRITLGGQWQIHTPWKTLQVTSQNWPYTSPIPTNAPPPTLDTAAEGIFIGPTNGLVGHDWYVFVGSFDCGWL